jgi:hypothetical protein
MIEARNIMYSTLFILGATVALSLLAGVAYIHTICGLSAFIAIGHLITLDDDMPGEWCNPEGEKQLWHSSLILLATKFLIFVVILFLMVTFPSLKTFGA